MGVCLVFVGGVCVTFVVCMEYCQSSGRGLFTLYTVDVFLLSLLTFFFFGLFFFLVRVIGDNVFIVHKSTFTVNGNYNFCSLYNDQHYYWAFFNIYSLLNEVL